MLEKVKEILEYHSESHSIDFKKEQYPIENHSKKHELLKDISAMANHPSNEDKYIIIGVKEKNGKTDEYNDLIEIIDQAKYQQFIDNNIEPCVNFEYKVFNYKGHQLAYFRIFNNANRPYLIKKEVRNFLDKNKIEYREGDGFIRAGTSTKKMTKIDFDAIYKTKYIPTDRKLDIIVTPYFGIPNDETFSAWPVKYFDISIENISNRSIELDVEMKAYKGPNYVLLSEKDLMEEINKQRTNKNDLLSYQISNFTMPSLHIDFKNNPDHVWISRSKLRNERTAINIPQKSIKKDVFCQYLIVYEKEPSQIKADIIIRSDDFIEGALYKTIEVKDDPEMVY